MRLSILFRCKPMCAFTKSAFVLRPVWMSGYVCSKFRFNTCTTFLCLERKRNQFGFFFTFRILAMHKTPPVTRRCLNVGNKSIPRDLHQIDPPVAGKLDVCDTIWGVFWGVFCLKRTVAHDPRACNQRTRLYALSSIPTYVLKRTLSLLAPAQLWSSFCAWRGR